MGVGDQVWSGFTDDHHHLPPAMFHHSPSSLFPPVFDIYGSDPKQQAFGFTSFHSPADIAAPSVDSFELDLDLLSQDNDFYQLEVTQVNSAYSQPIISACGPGSAITRSSESSAIDTLSFYSEPFHSPSHHSFTLDDMDFHRICVDDYSGGTVDPTSFGALPPTPPRSPVAPVSSNANALEKPYINRTSFSDYSPQKRDSISSDFFSQLGLSPPVAQSTISPSHITTSLSLLESNPRPLDDLKPDPRKKYRCNACPRCTFSLS